MDQTLQSYLARIAPTVAAKSAQAVIELAAEGATVPFIARYRKEKTGNLDEVQIRAVIEGHETFNEIVKRKAFLMKEIGEQNNLTAEIQKRIDLSWDLGELEEIYKPFKKKKKTKATIAREAGLEPLATWIWDMGHGKLKDSETMEMKAKNFLNPTAKIVTYEDALKGAQDILVEKIANDAELRAMVAKNYQDNGRVIAKAAKGYKANSKFEMYKEFEEPVKTLLDSKNNHRYLAMRRGWQEEELSVDVKADDEANLSSYEKFATSTPDNQTGEYLKQCARLALNVYVLPSIVNEVHRVLKEKADEDAIKVFAENVRKLLLGSPFGPKCVLGVDPGLRTGCKIALIDKGGNFISHTVLYTLGDGAEAKAKTLFSEVMKQIQIEAIAVGNGTAGRETDAFIRKVLKDLGKSTIPVVMVNESGASVYSASDVARLEFPELDITVRGAISIARRLQDPLAELVKIDPKSIGVGQYQHDVSQTQLKKSLEAVVESCVNNVGVDVNTASSDLLSHVAGIGPALAKGIVEYRKKTLFADRTELLKVPKFSAKVFEQAAGFLRIPTGKQVLDSTGIHPERYQAVTDMAKDMGVSLSEVIGSGASKLLASRTKWAQLVGEFTFDDIVKELEKPGRDPRDPFKVFQFREDIFEVKDLQEGMICPGIVTNVTNFGAFVDIGVHQDGLVHISALSHKFVEDPRKVVNPGDHVTVKVLKVDQVKNQISLTMKMDDAVEAAAPRERRPDQGRGTGPKPAPGATASKGSHRSPGASAARDSKMGPMTSGRPQAGGSPFNNPFAALINTSNTKK